MTRKLASANYCNIVRYTNCSWNSGLTAFHLTVFSCLEFLFCGHRTLKRKMKIKKISNCDLTRKLASANYCNIVRYTIAHETRDWRFSIWPLSHAWSFYFLDTNHWKIKWKWKKTKKHQLLFDEKIGKRYYNIGCGVSSSGIQNQSYLWLKMNMFKGNFYLLKCKIRKFGHSSLFCTLL